MKTSFAVSLVVCFALACGKGSTSTGEPSNETGVRCGTGTHETSGQCLPDPDCGPGTHVDNGQCVADPDCGPGTVADGGECLPATQAHYEIRTPVTTMPGDGYSLLPVELLGTKADGTVSTEDVLVTVSRAGAGTFSSAAVTLAATATTTYFTPCSTAAAPDCKGTVKLQLALASDPTTILASREITISEPDGVGSAAMCLTGGNVLFFDGNDYIYNGQETVSLGDWSMTASSNDLALHLTPSDSSKGLWWDLEFSTAAINKNLAAQVYDNAERAPFASPGHPGMEISGDGRGCNTLTGKFQIVSLVKSGLNVTGVTATFEQHCEGGTSVLRGCVHYTKP